MKTKCGATCHASIQEVKAEGSEVQGQPGLQQTIRGEIEVECGNTS